MLLALEIISALDFIMMNVKTLPIDYLVPTGRINLIANVIFGSLHLKL